jgi:hypothetical protein
MLYACGGQAGRNFGCSLFKLAGTAVADRTTQLALVDQHANMMAEGLESSQTELVLSGPENLPFQAALESLSLPDFESDTVCTSSMTVAAQSHDGCLQPLLLLASAELHRVLREIDLPALCTVRPRLHGISTAFTSSRLGVCCSGLLSVDGLSASQHGVPTPDRRGMHSSRLVMTLETLSYRLCGIEWQGQEAHQVKAGCCDPRPSCG